MCCPTEIIFTYLFVYVYDNISMDNNYKFQSHKSDFLAQRGFGNGVESGRTVL